MTCYVLTGSCPKTKAELRDEVAAEADADGQPVRAEHWRMLGRRIRREGRDEPMQTFGLTFVCARSRQYDATVVCPCGHLSEYLCDEPIGRGKTCDRPMCRCCRTPVGDDLDRCPFHVEVSA